MRLINIKCNDFDSFKYSILLYLYYYNIKINYLRPTEINKHMLIHIYKFILTKIMIFINLKKKTLLLTYYLLILTINLYF